MAKKSVPPMTMAMEWKPPSPKEQIRMAAEHFAETVARVNPQTERLKNRIFKDAIRAAKAPPKGK